MPVTIGEFEVVAGSPPAERQDAGKDARKPELDERALQAHARKRRSRELRTRAS
jgi:hypothetical protein